MHKPSIQVEAVQPESLAGSRGRPPNIPDRTAVYSRSVALFPTDKGTKKRNGKNCPLRCSSKTLGCAVWPAKHPARLQIQRTAEFRYQSAKSIRFGSEERIDWSQGQRSRRERWMLDGRCPGPIPRRRRPSSNHICNAKAPTMHYLGIWEPAESSPVCGLTR